MAKWHSPSRHSGIAKEDWKKRKHQFDVGKELFEHAKELKAPVIHLPPKATKRAIGASVIKTARSIF